MARFGLFGDSYIKRLDKFFNGDIRVPGESIFVHQGGLRFDRLTDTMKHKMKAAETDIIFLSIGCNDISPNSVPEEIFDRICALVTEFEDAGVRQVFISEILPRADFSKSNPPGLTKSKFDRDRKRVNKLLSEKYGKNLVKFNDIHCPRDYDKDLVHLSYPTEASTTCGKLQKNLLRFLSTNVENQRKWQLHSAVYLQRYPVISQVMTDLEKQYKDYIDKLEVNKSLLSDHELNLKNEAGKQILFSKRDLEDQWQKLLESFEFESRVTEADKTGNMKTIKRKLDRKLLLIVKQKLGDSTPVWSLPQVQVLEGESMRQAAERALSTRCGEDVQATFYGNAPCGYMKYRLPHPYPEFGVKLFFFKASYETGNITELDGVEDYKWVTLEEAKNCLFSKRQYEEVQKFDLDF